MALAEIYALHMPTHHNSPRDWTSHGNLWRASQTPSTGPFVILSMDRVWKPAEIEYLIKHNKYWEWKHYAKNKTERERYKLENGLIAYAYSIFKKDNSNRRARGDQICAALHLMKMVLTFLLGQFNDHHSQKWHSDSKHLLLILN